MQAYGPLLTLACFRGEIRWCKFAWAGDGVLPRRVVVRSDLSNARCRRCHGSKMVINNNAGCAALLKDHAGEMGQ
jgi:hypothetical protein